VLPEDDRVRLQHMLDAARRAVRFAAGQDRDRLNAEDNSVPDALKHLLSVIGEAASKVSPGTRSRVDEIPWSDVVGMRHRLIHAYFDINLDILWATVQDSLPPLVRLLESALAAGE
jgi:uncharacterized protein with HEPN domain